MYSLKYSSYHCYASYCFIAISKYFKFKCIVNDGHCQGVILKVSIGSIRVLTEVLCAVRRRKCRRAAHNPYMNHIELHIN